MLTAAKPHLRPCPYLGRYIVTGLSTRPSGGASVVSDTETSITQCSDLQFQSLNVGCTEVNTMQFHSSCSVAETSSKFLIVEVSYGHYLFVLSLASSSTVRPRTLHRGYLVSVFKMELCNYLNRCSISSI